MKRFLAGLLALFMILALAACGGQDAGTDAPAEPEQSDGAALESVVEPKSPVEGKTVVLIPRAADDPFYMAANEGAQRYAAQWGLEIRYMDGAGASAEAQADAIRQAVELGVDGVCLSAIDAQAVGAALREARTVGVCVTTWDADALPGDRTLMVSQGTAGVMGSMLVEMGVASLKERAVDPAGEVLYLWNGDEADAEDAAWYAAAKDYIQKNHPAWVELDAPYASGEALLDDYGADVDLILCGSATALTGQCQTALDRALTAADVTITGFCPPSEMAPYLEAGVCTRWGLWDAGMQSAMGCYLAAWLSDGNGTVVGDVVNIPRIGSFEILANSELAEEQDTLAANNGVVLLPERIVFTAENVGDHHY